MATIYHANHYSRTTVREALVPGARIWFQIQEDGCSVESGFGVVTWTDGDTATIVEDDGQPSTLRMPDLASLPIGERDWTFDTDGFVARVIRLATVE
jgi:hypothetical protein